MGKEREKADKERERNNMMLGVVWNWNCAASELKLLVTALLILFTVITLLLQFIPPRFAVTTSDLRLCISRLAASADSPPPAQPPTTNNFSSVTEAKAEEDEVTANGTMIKRAFNPYGWAAYSFITMGSYRGGLNTFAVVALSSKPLHVYGKPSYRCEWIPYSNADNKSESIFVDAYRMLPDWGYGRVYTVVVLNCTFTTPINADSSGGRLVLHSSVSGSGNGGDGNLNLTDTIDALAEPPGSLNASLFDSDKKPKYEYVYCGSPLYGNLSPQRVREWMAYHVRLFGVRSLFVIYDAGGIHPEALEVLKPWMELGYVTLHDIRDQERFDGYYHNQFLVVNDCLHRYKFMAEWMFFFDLDEYIYVPPKSTLRSVLDSLSGYTQFTIEQMPMSSRLCQLPPDGNAAWTYRRWGFEKLVYRDVKRGIRRDRKYVVQPRNVYATGVHLSQNFAGKTTHKTEGLIKYFHYHGTIAERREPCRTLLNSTQWQFTLDAIPHVVDTTLCDVAGAVKRFELRTIGPRLLKTRQ